MTQWSALVPLFLLSAAGLFGQAQSGTIVGTVTDQAGAVVPNATIQVINEGTQFSRSVITNESGQYVATSFPTGKITFRVEQPGFQRLVRSGVELTAADTLTVDLHLTIGNVQETVEVTGEAPLLQSATAAVSTLISNQQIVDTPLNGRSFVQLLQLGSGAIPTTPGLTTAIGGRNMNASTSIAVNGSIFANNSYLVDGMFNKEMWLNGIVLAPPVDSIQEVRVMASNFSAEYGAAAGAVTVVQTKSGTNSFHGSGYEFVRNDKFDANSFFNNRNGAAKNPYRRNNFGATFGGPIQHDKTFFFMDYEGTRIRQSPTSSAQTIPTLAQRAMVQTGDFLALGTQVYDPTTLDSAGNRVPFAGNQIPQSRLDPAAKKLFLLLPQPTSSAATRNYVYSAPSKQQNDQFDLKGDRNLSAADRLFLKYSYSTYDAVTAGTIAPAANPIVDVGPWLTGGSPSTMQNWSATANYTKVVGPTLVNEFRMGVVRTVYISDISSGHLPVAQNLGIPNINISDRTAGLPSYSIAGSLGFASIGQGGQIPDGNRTTSYQFEDIVTKIKGNHTIKAGARYMRHDFNGLTAISPRGIFTFSGTLTRQKNDTANRPTSLSDFALGYFSNATRSVQSGIFGMRFFESGLFVEDAWRATNRLTVTLGIRHEMQSPPYEVHDRWTNFNVITGELWYANQDGHNRALRRLDDNNFGPRLGVTYMLTNDHKTVLRLGGGIAYVESFNVGKQLHQNPPLTTPQQFVVENNGVPLPYRISDGLPLPVVTDYKNRANLTDNYIGYDMGMKDSKSMQWSAGIQRELISNLVLDVAYVGSRNLDLINSLNMNQASPGPGAIQPRRRLYSIDPSLQDVDYRTNWGASKYHSLQVNLRKRYSNGLTLSAAYTWSHNLTNTRQPNASTRPQDPNCSACEWGNAPEDRHQTLVINHLYELPFGHGRQFVSKGVLSQILGNWDVSGVWTMYSGTYSSPAQSGSISNANATGGAANSTERPDRIRDGNLPVGQRTIDAWYDVGAFVAPAQYTFGNAALGIIENPGYFGVDMGIHRNFVVKERYKLAFRWEMFNTFNRANFGAPNTTLGATTVGQISSTQPARIMQLSLKLNF
jgi:hypothetical protein